MYLRRHKPAPSMHLSEDRCSSEWMMWSVCSSIFKSVCSCTLITSLSLSLSLPPSYPWLSFLLMHALLSNFSSFSFNSVTPLISFPPTHSLTCSQCVSVHVSSHLPLSKPVLSLSSICILLFFQTERLDMFSCVHFLPHIHNCTLIYVHKAHNTRSLRDECSGVFTCGWLLGFC